MADDLLDFEPGEPLRGTPYRVLKRIGAGGMGAVFEIEHTRLKKRLVAKTMHPGLRARQDFLTRMEIEAQILARIAHPNIVEVHDLGVTEDGIPFFVMERLEGSDLRKLLRSRRYLDIHDALAIVEDVLEGLAHAHREGVVHRDIKPENIFLARNGAETITKILDFGIAKVMDDSRNLTGARFLGTCQYAACEQLRGERASEKTDIYAVGCVLFELIAGRRPFSGPTTNDFIRQHLNEMPPRLSSVAQGVPAALDALVASALEKDPAKRPISALWFANQLHQIQQVAENVELAQANTTEEMLLTAITEGVSSSSPLLPASDKTAEDTVKDPAVPAALGATVPEWRQETVRDVAERPHPDARAKTPRMSTEDHFRRADTRTGHPAPYVKTEELPPSAQPERTDGSWTSPRRAVSGAREPVQSLDESPTVGPFLRGRGWRRKLVIALPAFIGLVASILILAFARPRESAALAPSAAPWSSASSPPSATTAASLPSPAITSAVVTSASAPRAPIIMLAPAVPSVRRPHSPSSDEPDRDLTGVPVAPSVVAPRAPAPRPSSQPVNPPRDDIMRTL